MTQPDPAAPGAPADTAPTQPANPQSMPQGQDPNAAIDFDALPDNVKAYIGSLRKEAGGHRQGKTAAEKTATEAQARLDAVLKAAGIKADGTAATDPEALAKQLTERAAAAEEALWGERVRNRVHQHAASLGGNPQALLDSLSFVDSLDELADDDPTSAEFKAALESKIKAALAANPALRTSTKQAAGRMGADITGSGGGGKQRPAGLGAALAARLAGGK